MSLHPPTTRRSVDQAQTYVGGVRSHARFRWRCHLGASLKADRGAPFQAKMWPESVLSGGAGILILPPRPREGTNTHARDLSPTGARHLHIFRLCSAFYPKVDRQPKSQDGLFSAEFNGPLALCSGLREVLARFSCYRVTLLFGEVGPRAVSFL